MRKLITTTGVVTLLSASTALAAAPAPGLYLHANSTEHHHYAVQLDTECFTNGCKHATTISVDLVVGNKKKPSISCPPDTLSIATAKEKGSTFKGSVQFAFAGGHASTFTITGVFKSSKKVVGTIVGPKACGGTDHYTAVAGALAGTET